MDISFWKNLSNDIEINYTSKQYYKQYLYKLEVWAPGCKSIHAENIQKDLDYRGRSQPGYNLGGSWWNTRLQKWLVQADLTQLNGLQFIKNNFSNVKIRTEEPKISFYAENEQVLKDIVNTIDSRYHKHVVNFSGPENTETQEILQTNKLLVKRKPKYQYKVSIREKRFSTESRKQILNYLTGLGDLVKIPAGTQKQLDRNSDWMWGCYFYTNDPGVVDFVRLMNPDIIREVCELVHIENK